MPSFCLELHVGGVFVNEPKPNYRWGKIEYEYGLDSETFSLKHLEGMFQKLGYVDVCKIFYKVPKVSFGCEFKLLHNEDVVSEMLTHVKENATILVFAEHQNRGEGTDEGEESVLDVEADIDSDASSLRDDLESDDEEFNEARDKVRKYIANVNSVKVVAEPNFSHLENNVVVPLDDEDLEGGEEHREEALEDEPDSGDETEYMDSSDYDSPIEDEEDGELLRIRTQWTVFNPATDYFNIDPMKGMKFASFEELKNFIRCYAVKMGKQLKFVKSTNSILHVRCVKGCPWRLWATPMQRERSIQIKTYREKHKNCVRTFEPSIANSKFISWLYKDKIYDNPSWKLREFKKDIAERYKVKVSISKCYRAKKKALSEVEFSLNEHYKRLWDYVGEIKKANPESTVKVSVDRPDLDQLPLFKRLYVCMDACRKGFIEGCRPVISMDGCFLKGFCKGELLVAIGRDGNNQMFPLAWAQVEVENKSSWAWFIDLLKSDLGISQGAGYTVISDQQKGLVPAITEALPLAEHRMCARHIYANFRKTNPGSQMKGWFWAAAKSGTPQEFDNAMDEIRKLSNPAAEQLKAGKYRAWSRAFFDFFSNCDSVDNNMSETFNSTIIEARQKPIINMFEDIRLYVIRRMQKKRQEVHKWDGVLSPKAKLKLDKNLDNHVHWEVTHIGDHSFEVRCGREAFGVNLDTILKTGTCSCRHWGLSGIPCTHSAAAILYMHDDPVQYVSHYFKVDSYKKAYGYFMKPLNGQNMWVRCHYDPMLPPIDRRMPGRPKKCRNKDPCEERKSSKAITKSKYPGTECSRKGRVMTCSKCHRQGHNKATCKATSLPLVEGPSSGQGHNKATCKATSLPLVEGPSSKNLRAVGRPKQVIIPASITEDLHSNNIRVVGRADKGTTLVEVQPTGQTIKKNTLTRPAKLPVKRNLTWSATDENSSGQASIQHNTVMLSQGIQERRATTSTPTRLRTTSSKALIHRSPVTRSQSKKTLTTGGSKETGRKYGTVLGVKRRVDRANKNSSGLPKKTK